MKLIDAGKLKTEIERRIKNAESCPFIEAEFGAEKRREGKILGYKEILSLIDSLQQEQTDMGEVSDGYHTFNELYYYRMLYNAAFFNLLPKEWVHKSKRHHTGEECFGGGWFIVMANLPTGQISNHYELKDWDLFQVPEKEFADEWDGHTPQEAAERLHKYLQQEQQEEPDKSMEEAAEKSSAQYYKDAGYSPFPNVETAAHKSGFIAGAKWQKHQMLKDAVEGEFANTPFPTIYLDDCKDYNFKDNQKVRIVVLKAEEE